MPPKKDGTSKKKKTAKKSAKTKSTGIIDGVPVSDMTKEQMVQHIARIKNEVDKEREERNFYQVERDKIMEFWDVTKRQLSEKNTEIRKKDDELESVQNKYLLEIEFYKQKIKFLLHEQENELCQHKIENLKSLQSAQECNRTTEKNFFQNLAMMKKQLREREDSYQNLLKDAERKHAQEVIRLRETFRNEMQDIEAKYEKRIERIHADLETRHKIEMQNVEDAHNDQMKSFLKKRDEDFAEMRSHYNGLVQQDLNIIDTLKEQAEATKDKDEKLEKQMAKISMKNKQLAAQLPKAEQTVAELQKKLLNYERDKESLAKTHLHLEKKTAELKRLRLKYNVVEETASKIEDERDVLKKNFINAIQDIQQKSDLKNVILEEKMNAVRSELEQREMQLKEILACSDVDDAVPSKIRGHKESAMVQEDA